MSKSNDQERRKKLEEEFKNELAEGRKSMPDASSQRILEAIHARIEERTGQMQKNRRLPRLKWTTTAVAASLLILAISLWQLPTRKIQSPTTSPALAQTIKTNNSHQDLHLILPDHSTVELSPGSTLYYYPTFEPGRRNITLTGKATFDVTTDATRPFSVIAGTIQTTALGTRFTVSTLIPNNVQVHLLEGKVVLRSNDKTQAMREVYLQPGQQFVLDQQHRQYAVSDAIDSPMAVAQKSTQKNAPQKPISPALTDTSILEFNQEPLPHVLDAIGRKYGVVFRLSGHGFNTMSVTGKFLPSDSLSTVLTLLGSINGLQFSNTGNTIVVARAQP
ncbi:MAG: FecR domain-containing protein [Bacteroidetes bacterium]|nr:FecR domain-containing protein [Bacteroidota bacterium]